MSERDTIQKVLDKYPSLTLIEKDRLQERRQQFVPHIIYALNNTKWGYLIKTGGKVQDDIVVDKNTMHHYDCMTAIDNEKDSSIPEGFYRIRGMWKDQGPVPSKWKWGSVDDYTIPDLPIVDNIPDPEPPVDEPGEPNPVPTTVEERVSRLELELKRLNVMLNTITEAIENYLRTR